MRTLTAGMTTAFQDNSAMLFYLVHLALTDSVYLSTLPFNISWNGQTWLGIGDFGGVENISETVDTAPSGFKFSLTNIDNTYVGLFFNEPYQRRVANVYIGAIDANNQIVASPYGPFTGRLDLMEFVLGESVSSVSVTCESEIALASRPDNLAYSDAHQQNLYPGDRFCEFASDTSEREIRF
jgi:hypothetical protein